jgi:hypothetical protein
MNKIAVLLLVFLSATSLIVVNFHPVSAADKVIQTITLNPIANATVSNTAELDNNTELKVGQSNDMKWQVFLLFDLSSLPKYAKIAAATLILKSETILPTGNRWVDAYSTSPNWKEDTITWNNKPSVEKFLDTEWVELSGENYFWYCTNAFMEDNEEVSVILELPSSRDSYVVFYSRQSQYEPQLELIYSVEPPSLADQILWAASWGLGVASVVAVVYVAYLWRKGYFKPGPEKAGIPQASTR